jgi:hypothetical protein
LSNGYRDAVWIVWIDQQCCFAFLSGASKVRQNNYTEVPARLESKKLLGALFLDPYCAFHSASHVNEEASRGLPESCR